MKILIATDGSRSSRQAVEKCCEFISTKKHTDIKILSVADRVVPVASEPFGASNEYYARIQSETEKKGQEAVAEAEKIVNTRLSGESFSVNTEVFRGSVKQVIIEEAENWGADLITVGSHGYGFFDRMMLGSVSDYVTHHAPCSVLIVRTKNGDVQERTDG